MNDRRQHEDPGFRAGGDEGVASDFDRFLTLQYREACLSGAAMSITTFDGPAGEEPLCRLVRACDGVELAEPVRLDCDALVPIFAVHDAIPPTIDLAAIQRIIDRVVPGGQIGGAG